MESAKISPVVSTLLFMVKALPRISILLKRNPSFMSALVHAACRSQQWAAISDVCIAKTQKSLSDNPKLLGRPSGFTITVREIEIAAGAGFLVPITGDMMRMPGLPSVPSAEAIDISDDGEISGLF